MMQIANPIYDIVFKYLMEDKPSAKLIIGTIINAKVVELDFLPQESSFFVPTYSFTVHRLDFSAKIKLADGLEKQVLIEIQKAKFATDIMRFRRYLGKQYQNDALTYAVKGDKREEKRAMPIITIYFLGYPLEHMTAPVIKVARQYFDATTGEELTQPETFIESLTHDSYVIQIPHLRPKRRTEVEQLLMIFDQRWIIMGDAHILRINEDDYPPRYSRIIRRLQKAIADAEVRNTMDAEDEVLEELGMLEREIASRDEAIFEQQKALTLRDQAIVEQQQAIASKDQAIVEQQQAIASKDQAIVEQQQAIASKDQAIVEQQQAIASKDQAIVEQQQAIASKDQAIVEQQQAIASKDQAIVEQQQAIASKDQAIVEQQQMIEELQKRLQTLNE